MGGNKKLHSQGPLVSLGCYNLRVGDLDNRYLFLKVLEAGKSTIKVQANLVSGEAFFLSCRQL